jgi:hypothetical protein
MIQLHGRWESDAVLRYIRDCPLECVDPSRDIMDVSGLCGSKSLSPVRIKKGQKVLTPVAKDKYWVEGVVKKRQGKQLWVQAESSVGQPVVIKSSNEKVVIL